MTNGKKPICTRYPNAPPIKPPIAMPEILAAPLLPETIPANTAASPPAAPAKQPHTAPVRTILDGQVMNVLAADLPKREKPLETDALDCSWSSTVVRNGCTRA
mmetsp:Transcript_41809/g.76649  ORF Transcript_41809/g.76649 Transcript_41809/m.76649 type:complete len:103 (-) Transcript_41809:224-532(-)